MGVDFLNIAAYRELLQMLRARFQGHQSVYKSPFFQCISRSFSESAVQSATPRAEVASDVHAEGPEGESNCAWEDILRDVGVEDSSTAELGASSLKDDAMQKLWWVEFQRCLSDVPLSALCTTIEDLAVVLSDADEAHRVAFAYVLLGLGFDLLEKEQTRLGMAVFRKAYYVIPKTKLLTVKEQLSFVAFLVSLATLEQGRAKLRREQRAYCMEIEQLLAALKKFKPVAPNTVVSKNETTASETAQWQGSTNLPDSSVLARTVAWSSKRILETASAENPLNRDQSAEVLRNTSEQSLLGDVEAFSPSGDPGGHEGLDSQTVSQKQGVGVGQATGDGTTEEESRSGKGSDDTNHNTNHNTNPAQPVFGSQYGAPTVKAAYSSLQGAKSRALLYLQHLLGLSVSTEDVRRKIVRMAPYLLICVMLLVFVLHPSITRHRDIDFEVPIEKAYETVLPAPDVSYLAAPSLTQGDRALESIRERLSNSNREANNHKTPRENSVDTAEKNRSEDRTAGKGSDRSSGQYDSQVDREAMQVAQDVARSQIGEKVEVDDLAEERFDSSKNDQNRHLPPLNLDAMRDMKVEDVGGTGKRVATDQLIVSRDGRRYGAAPSYGNNALIDPQTGDRVKPYFVEQFSRPRRFRLLKDTLVSSAPSMIAKGVEPLARGDKVEAIAKLGPWLEILSVNGNKGYIYASDVEELGALAGR